VAGTSDRAPAAARVTMALRARRHRGLDRYDVRTGEPLLQCVEVIRSQTGPRIYAEDSRRGGSAPGVDLGPTRSETSPIVPNGSSTPSTSRKTKAMAAHDNVTEQVPVASRPRTGISTTASHVGEAARAAAARRERRLRQRMRCLNRN
jgi:hypothetical protein